MITIRMDDDKVTNQDGSKTPKERCLRFLKVSYRIVSSHLGLVVLLILYSFIGAAIFQTLEGRHETKERSDVLAVRERIIASVWNSTRVAVDREEWAAELRIDLLDYEAQLHEAFLHGISSGSETPKWDYWGAFMYCATIYTTIGYGHIAPATTAGRVVTMFYALFGIPLCLIVMADLGKLFTRGIKFLWSFVRRLYYTKSCRKPTKTEPSKDGTTKEDTTKDGANKNGTANETTANVYNVDDDFNLPPLVAIAIAFVYIFLGALVYTRWESWTYLEAFYFVFISVSTIGFGDVLPEHPRYFLVSSFYILIGLSLVAMVINVIMEWVSVTLDKAATKVTEVTKAIGIDLDEDEEEKKEQESKKGDQDKENTEEENGVSKKNT